VERNLVFGYKKYKAYLQATQTLSKMITEQTWPGKKPSSIDLIELFASKSAWFAYYKPAFSRVSEFPEMVKWLEDSEEKGSDFDVWGITKEVYTMTDLKKFVGNGGTLVEKKRKRKKQESEREEREKGKGKRRRRDESSGRVWETRARRSPISM